jgi:molybdate transport system substrate-binding protein
MHLQRRRRLGTVGLPWAFLAWAATLTMVRSAAADMLRVFAASSLTEAFRDVAKLYEARHPADRVELNFAGTQVLRTQIEQGAAADVFAAADLIHADALHKAGLLGAHQIFARNRIVVVVPAHDAKVARLEDLARPGIRIVMAGAAVPVGTYTSEVLAKLDGAKLYGDDYRARVRANVKSEETNVRAVLAKVALDEADVGFVYATDAATSDEVRSIEIPERVNGVAEYPIGILVKAAAPAQAQAFVTLVLGDDGQAILRRYGFAG